MKLKCVSPCTFFSQDSPIDIKDSKGNIFFFHTNTDRKINFNLPVGSYSTKNLLIQKDFLPYEKLNDVKFPINPKDFLVVVGNNKHKATISMDNRTILVDRSIANHTYKPCKAFIIGHEIGHIIIGGSKYDKSGKMILDAEKWCDDFSRNYMLATGYNPSQIKIASELLLNDFDRKNCIHENTINLNLRR